MDLLHSTNEIKKISLSMFRKNFFGVFHGSISARVEKNQFIINKQSAIFDDLQDSDLTLLSSKKDYRWNDAMKHEKIAPKDYFGCIRFNEILVYDPKQFDDWYERAETEIYRAMIEKNTNVVVIKGYGVYAYSRSPQLLAKDIALLENSCKLLHFTGDCSDFSI